MRKIKFSSRPPRGDRRHYLTEEDIRVLLSRLPEDLYRRLRAVHFNDRSSGGKVLGYVNRGRREVAICAQPPRMSFNAHRTFTRKRDRRSPRWFGALRGAQWPRLAVRRFLLYSTFLHELGHLQLVDARAKSNRRQFAHETKAQEFADYWRETLWSKPFDHLDLVHNTPSPDELGLVERVLRAPKGKKLWIYQDLLDLHFYLLCGGRESDPKELLDELEPSAQLQG